MAHHHLDETTLLEYTTGALPEPIAMLTATHLALCTSCRATHSVLESAGGALLDDVVDTQPTDAVHNEAESASDLSNVRNAVFAQLDTPLTDAPEPRGMADTPDIVIPKPLRDYLGGGLDSVKFRRVSSALAVADILPDYPEITTRLMRITAGKAMPVHSHEGDEYTLVLDGGFSDGSNTFHRGDVAIADENVEHTPVAEQGADCICLAVNCAPVQLTGTVGKLLNRFIKF